MKYRSAIQLLKKYLSGKASVNEVMKIDKWYAEEDEKQNEKSEPVNEEVKETMYRHIVSAINKNKIIPFYKKPFFQVAAAAVLLKVLLRRVRDRCSYYLSCFRNSRRYPSMDRY